MMIDGVKNAHPRASGSKLAGDRPAPPPVAVGMVPTSPGRSSVLPPAYSDPDVSLRPLLIGGAIVAVALLLYGLIGSWRATPPVLTADGQIVEVCLRVDGELRGCQPVQRLEAP